MKIIHGEYEILDSGFIISADLSDTKFVLSEIPLLEIVFRISMDGEQSEISLDFLSDTTIELVFTKPQQHAFGPTNPIEVGHLRGKKLYVSFRVHMRGSDSSYGLEYTFYTKATLPDIPDINERPVQDDDIITL